MNSILKIVIVLIASLSIHSASFCQSNPEFNASLDTNAIYIGDHAKLHLRLILNSKEKINWPLFNDTISKEIEIIDRSEIDTAFYPDKNQYIFHQTLTITSWDSGYYVIPPIKIIYGKINDSTPIFAHSEPLLFEVHSIAIDTTIAIKDIKGQLAIPLTFKEAVPYILGGLGIIAIILLIIYFVRKSRKSEPIINLPKKPTIPPHETALKNLEALRKEKLWQNNEVKLFHSRLTEIIRVYIDGKYNLNAMEMTSDEIMSSIEHLLVDNNNKQQLQQMLSLADFVKFAKGKPLPTEHDMSFNNAVDFVKKTIIDNQSTSEET